MGEADVVRSTPSARTVDSLARDLRGLGLRPGASLIVHSSLRALGWVSGGAAAVIGALCDVVTPDGTLVMPAQSQDLTDPARWGQPAIPASWHGTVRDTMPPFDPLRTPTRDMGRIAELFRTWPDVARSNHPTSSFAAWGRAADAVVRDQPLEDPFGERSPLARLYELDARVLLLGVSFESCTGLHLAERRAWPDQQVITEGSPVIRDGSRRWIRYETPVLRTELFEDAGLFLAEAGLVSVGLVGSAPSRSFAMRAAIDAMVERWRRARTGRRQ